jgi:ribosomal protein S18 acetylase RimI-like enzyme
MQIDPLTPTVGGDRSRRNFEVPDSGQMKNINLRIAKPADLPDLEKIENRCFASRRRSSRRALSHSLRSPRQVVCLAEYRAAGERQAAGAMILWRYPRTVRLYSIGVLPAFRGQGVGYALVQRALLDARRSKRSYVSLEADRRDSELIRWYQQFGFVITRRLKDYYAPGRDAVRMRYHVDS